MASTLIFRQLFDQTSSTYTYLLADPASGEAILIDPVFEQHLRDRALIDELGLALRYTLDTHCHADHVTGAWLMQQTTEAKIGISARYGDMISGVDCRLEQGDQLSFGHRSLVVRATPGHTDGCLTYVLDDQSMAFTGDCLLIRGAGRCDFQQGSAHKMFQSIQEQIFSLPEHCLLYPAHDYSGRTVSTVREERQHNPRIGGQANERDFVGFMENLQLPHPKKIDIAIPANCRSGKPEDGQILPLATWGPVRQTYAGLREIEPHWVAAHLNQVHILDVRDISELDEADEQIPNAQLIPLSQLRSHLSDIPTQKPIIAVCHSGRRSGQATVILRQHGIQSVANLRGGMVAWQSAGLPTVQR